MTEETPPSLPAPATPVVTPPVSDAVKPKCAPGTTSALLVSLIALGAALSQPWWIEHVRPAPAAPVPATAQVAPTVDLAPLQRELANLREAIPDTTQLTRRLQELEAGLQDAVPAQNSAPDVDALNDRISQLESELELMRKQAGAVEKSSSAEKTFMASGLQIVTAWQSGQPFAAAWLSLNGSAAVLDPTLSEALNDAASTLLPWRDTGIPTLARLSSDFPEMARKVVASAAPAGETWWQQSLQRIKGLVVIRRQAERVSAEETSAEAVVARAEATLAGGDLPAALAQLQLLDEVATAAASQWLQGARARVQADTLGVRIATVTAHLLSPDTVPEEEAPSGIEVTP